MFDACHVHGNGRWLSQPLICCAVLCRAVLPAVTQVPLPVREAVYDMMAANRYKLFGKTPACQVRCDTGSVYFLSISVR